MAETDATSSLVVIGSCISPKTSVSTYILIRSAAIMSENIRLTIDTSADEPLPASSQLLSFYYTLKNT